MLIKLLLKLEKHDKEELAKISNVVESVDNLWPQVLVTVELAFVHYICEKIAQVFLNIVAGYIMLCQNSEMINDALKFLGVWMLSLSWCAN